MKSSQDSVRKGDLGPSGQRRAIPVPPCILRCMKRLEEASALSHSDVVSDSPRRNKSWRSQLEAGDLNYRHFPWKYPPCRAPCIHKVSLSWWLALFRCKDTKRSFTTHSFRCWDAIPIFIGFTCYWGRLPVRKSQINTGCCQEGASAQGKRRRICVSVF